jgi:hypothetical protein
MAEKNAVNTWEHRFEVYLKEDAVAERALERLLDSGFSRDRVLIALARCTNPSAGRRLKESLDDFTPTRVRTERLAKRCAALGLELRRTYGALGTFWPEAGEVLSLADTLVRGGGTLVLADHSQLYSRFTVKSFWRQLPLAILHQRLNIPSSLPWERWCRLYHVARQAHGQFSRIEIQPKSMKRNHDRFLARFPKLDLPVLAQCFAEIAPARPNKFSRWARKMQ